MVRRVHILPHDFRADERAVPDGELHVSIGEEIIRAVLVMDRFDRVEIIAAAFGRLADYGISIDFTKLFF